ncbi:pentatricopeptide repeat-containing protein At3g09040, mitochondrial-like [Cryptomeria japonica]|uniref:pentatricopeptide repeat-containing protein At3g09040, mitochondrial-like n=1 Tax=Cryptomeria japonica TaxID=3369 RepID=UPI0025AC3ACC|nr:pentatricopeptide repeat-containing protein At3g09040, mitochondrial-like [Cryptomeria japonica]
MPSTPNLSLTLSALLREARLKEALHILLTTPNPAVNSSIYLQLLQNCISKKALSEGKQIHSYIAHGGFVFATDTLFQNNVINMYVKCGSLADARELFDQMTKRDVFSWNIIIAAYRRNGCTHEALTVFHQMQQTGTQPDQFTFASILPACAKIKDMEKGMEIHQNIIEMGILSDVVANALLDMYVKCGNIDKARKLFDNIPQKNVVLWTAMIAGYAQIGFYDEALKLFKEMPHRDVISWNVMIAGYAQNGLVEKALETFKQMQLAGVKPIPTTFASILPGCAKTGTLQQGMTIHQSIIECGYLSDVVIASALVDMYAKCRRVHTAYKLFKKMPQRNVVSWNVIIAGYAQNGFFKRALETFKQMKLEGIKPDSTTFASILSACAKMGYVEQGMDIHQSAIENGFLSDVIVTSALVDMYAKCGSVHMAYELFEKLPQRNVISWNAMISGYAQNGFAEKALETFKQMQFEGVNPDSTTLASILPACAKMGALKQGKIIHQIIIEIGFLSDVVIVSALIDMYAKCGSIDMAREMFEKMPQRNVISWNVMIAGYAQNGFCKDALKLFELMKHSGTYPDHVSFTCVLLACSHVGLVEEGCKYFNAMGDSYCITPTINHYMCVVDLLGRAGYLEETLNFIIKMPVKPMVVVWTCLLGACRAHKNIGLGVFAATLLFELDPKNAGIYVLLSNIYADAKRRHEVQMETDHIHRQKKSMQNWRNCLGS